MIDDLISWLRSTLDAAEAKALAATPGPWWRDPGKQWLGPDSFERYDRTKGEEFVGYGGPSPFTGCVAATGPASHAQSMSDAAFIADNDPARALRQVQAHRAILDVVATWKHNACQDGWYSCSQATVENGYEVDEECADDDRRGKPCDCGLEFRQRKILGPLASIHLDRDGYREEWSQ